MKNKNKIIFLDFDGVLNPKDNEDSMCCIWKDGFGVSKDKYGYMFDKRCVNWLNHIHHHTGCCYVISSSWRTMGIEALRNMFHDRGIGGDIIGVTPSNENNYLRGQDIQQWIDAEGQEGDIYCIIDDQNDMLQHQEAIHVRPDSRFGLTKYEAISVKSILQKFNQ